MNLKKFLYQYPAEIFLFLATLFIRFPFFFRDYIDKDESTFILMGQSIADGHLPYDHLWDLKPPLLFYLFAIIEKLFPHSFVAIRFFGVIVVFLSALLLMRIARLAELKNSFLIAIGYVVLGSEFGSLQGVMSEHLAVLFILFGLVYFLRRRNSIDFFIAGFAFGCAVLCKLNYAYAIVLLFLVYVFEDWHKVRMKRTVTDLVALAIGVVLPVFLMLIPFALEGKTDLFINSVFLAPMKYASASGLTLGEKLKVSWWILAITAVICYLAARFSSTERRGIVFASIAILAGTVYTFFSSGIVNGHYLVEVYPFFLILIFGVLIKQWNQPRLAVVAVIVFLLSFESISEYVKLATTRKDPTQYRPTFEVVSELKKHKLENSKIFFSDYHIGYWLLHQYPLTKSTTHPSNLGRPFLFPYFNDSNKTSLQELKSIMENVRPDVIVSQTNGIEFFDDTSSENRYFKEELQKDFKSIYTDPAHRIYIWQRDTTN
ncbi:MAG: ArnT family glycosyltransferase [Flavisolibacter sp.]